MCDVLCMKETHKGHGAVRPRVPGMNIVAEIAHEQYGSILFILIPAHVLPFTMEEVMKGIKILKNNKYAGLDGMLCEQIKHIGLKALFWLKEMMSNMLVSKKFPSPCCKSKVIAILKPGKDTFLPESYRPISLLCHTYKKIVELNEKKGRWHNQKNGLPHESVPSSVLFNVYTND